MLTYGALLLLDSERPHSAARTRALLEQLNWELFGHQRLLPEELVPIYTEQLMEGDKTWHSCLRQAHSYKCLRTFWV
jgi:hypothetical protein